MSSCRATNAKAFLPDGVNVPACPSCGAWGNRAGGGVHDRTCALAAALREPDAVAVVRLAARDPGFDEAAALRTVADKLKSIEPCAASAIEGHPCVTRDVRWCGREVARLADRLDTHLRAALERGAGDEAASIAEMLEGYGLADAARHVRARSR